MGLAPEKASRIKARDTQTTSPDPWSYQVDILVLSMDLTADRTWDQSTRRRR